MLIYANYDSDQYVNINKSAHSMIDTHSLKQLDGMKINSLHSNWKKINSSSPRVKYLVSL